MRNDRWIRLRAPTRSLLIAEQGPETIRLALAGPVAAEPFGGRGRPSPAR